MKIWTSYFGHVRKLRSKFPDLTFVSVAGRTPESKSVELLKFPEVAPKYSWWKEWHDRFEGNLESEESKAWYEKRYSESLFAELSPEQIRGRLEELGKGNDVCLLCYETPWKFCHRHLLAKWLSGCVGYEIKEITA